MDKNNQNDFNSKLDSILLDIYRFDKTIVPTIITKVHDIIIESKKDNKEIPNFFAGEVIEQIIFNCAINGITTKTDFEDFCEKPIIKLILETLLQSHHCKVLDNYDVPYFCDIQMKYKQFVPSICKTKRKSLEYMSKKNPELFIGYIDDKKIANNLAEAKLELTKDAMILAIRTGKTKLIEKYIHMGIQLETEYLEVACSIGTKDVILLLLDNKIIPTKRCFENIVWSFKYDQVKVNEYVKLLINFGYVLTEENLYYAAGVGLYIDCYEMFDIKIKLDLINILNQKKIKHPYKLPDGVDIFEVECSKPKNLDKIRKMIKNGSIVTIECIEAACRIPNNMTTIHLLLSTNPNLKLTSKCLKNCIDASQKRNYCQLVHLVNSMYERDTKLEKKTSNIPTEKIENNIKNNDIVDDDIDDDVEQDYGELSDDDTL